MERACQAKAQEVCQQLTNDYEAKVAGVRVYNYVYCEKSIIHLQKYLHEKGTTSKSPELATCTL